MGAMLLILLGAVVLMCILALSLIFDAVVPRELIIAELRAKIAAYEAEREESLFRRPARRVA